MLVALQNRILELPQVRSFIRSTNYYPIGGEDYVKQVLNLPTMYCIVLYFIVLYCIVLCCIDLFCLFIISTTNEAISFPMILLNSLIQ